MRNNLIKFYSTIICFLTSFMLFAAPGDGSDDPGGLDGPEPAAPIDAKLYILVILGILFAFYTFRNNRKIA